jgi:hypothetical protein
MRLFYQIENKYYYNHRYNNKYYNNNKICLHSKDKIVWLNYLKIKYLHNQHLILKDSNQFFPSIIIP